MTRWLVTSKAEAAVDDLCSLDLEAPSQLRTDEGFGLLVGAWFDVKTESFKVDGGERLLSYGLRSAKVTVETCDQTKIGIQGRHEKIVHTESVETKVTEGQTKQGEAGGVLGFATPKFWRSIEVRASGGGEWKRAVTREKNVDGSYERVYRSVWNAGQKYWRLAGIEPDNDTGVLSRNMLGDEPLCQIQFQNANLGQAEVHVSIDSHLRDVWVELAPVEGASKEQKQSDKNRSAVCSAIFAKALNSKGLRKTKERTPDNPTFEVTLAQATLTLDRGPEETP